MKALFALVFLLISSSFAFGANDVCKNSPSYAARVDLANGDIRFERPRQTISYHYSVSFEGTDFNAVCRSLFGMKRYVQAAKTNVDFSGRIFVMSNGDIIFRDPNSYNYLTDPIVDWIVCSNRE